MAKSTLATKLAALFGHKATDEDENVTPPAAEPAVETDSNGTDEPEAPAEDADADEIVALAKREIEERNARTAALMTDLAKTKAELTAIKELEARLNDKIAEGIAKGIAAEAAKAGVPIDDLPGTASDTNQPPSASLSGIERFRSLLLQTPTFRQN